MPVALLDTLPMSQNGQNRILEFSPFLNQLVSRHPDWLKELENSGRLENSIPPAMDRLAECVEKVGLDPALRQFRNREMMRLIWRDLNELAVVDEILADLSTLADICLQATVSFHSRTMEEKHGIPRNADGQAQKLIVSSAVVSLICPLTSTSFSVIPSVAHVMVVAVWITNSFLRVCPVM